MGMSPRSIQEKNWMLCVTIHGFISCLQCGSYRNSATKIFDACHKHQKRLKHFELFNRVQYQRNKHSQYKIMDLQTWLFRDSSHNELTKNKNGCYTSQLMASSDIIQIRNAAHIGIQQPRHQRKN